MDFKGDLQLFQFAKLSGELEGFNEETVTRSLSGKQVTRNNWTARLGFKKSHGEVESCNVIKDWMSKRKKEGRGGEERREREKKREREGRDFKQRRVRSELEN